MPPESFLPNLQKAVAAIAPLEWLAVGFGLTQVLLARRGSIWNYAAGIAATLLSAGLMASAHLYAEAGLNLYYFFISIWGIYAWRRQPVAQQKPQFTTAREWQTVAGISILGTAAIAFLLSQFTSSDVPLWDASVTAIAWAGTWLLTRRRVENWLVLNGSNLLAFPLQIHKGLYLYAVLTLLLTLIAFDGFRLWRKEALSFRKNPAQE